MKLEIEGATIEAGGEEKIRKALAVLEQDTHAPREVSVKFTLHVHNEYPKHITVGKAEDGSPITKIVGSVEEENAELAKVKPVAGNPGCAASARSACPGQGNLGASPDSPLPA